MDESLFLNYGIAGLILLVFYKLFADKLARLEQSINRLAEVIVELRAEIRMLRKAGNGASD